MFISRDTTAKVSGPKGELSFIIPSGIKAEVSDGQIIVTQEKKNDVETNALIRINQSNA